ncbi:MAG: hypothetical protein QOJ64_2395 [Acidobacteriota bacterium]|nr:hypothetical protein [Acidobacteriota bacterium]
MFLAIAALALIGLADSVYLTVEHFAGRAVRCTITNGCEEVLNSAYSTIGRIPLAPLGAIAYFLVFSLATLSAFGNQITRTALLYLVGLMLVFSIWLFIVQAFVLHAFCQFCLLSGAVTLSLAVLVAIERFLPRRS